MAAHLEGKGASVLDFMGFAQKFGPVLSYIRIAPDPADINQVRIEPARADALIGCDLVVSSSPKASLTYSADHTRAVVNSAEMLTADFLRNRDANLRVDDRLAAIGNAVGAENLSTIDANRIAQKLIGDTIYANVLLLGYAWQLGLVPVSRNALVRAIELNNVAIENNKTAFAYGRMVAADPGRITDLLGSPEGTEESLDELIERRREFLVGYQNEALAKQFEKLVHRVREAEITVSSGEALTTAVARSYFKLLSYKDEYEVARLHTREEFLKSIRADYGKKARLRFHLAPPILNAGLDARGRPRKKEFGAWIIPLFRILARLKFLRGTFFDVFGKTAERRTERELIGEFEQLVEDKLIDLREDQLQSLTAMVSSYLDIRGYGLVKEESVKKVRQQLASMQAAGI